jgi:dolichol-phosphate mannosyltransferase
MKFAAWKLGFTIQEVPITFKDRKLGDSKMNKGIIKEGVLGVLKLRWMSMFKDYHNNVKNTIPDNSRNFQQVEVALEEK